MKEAEDFDMTVCFAYVVRVRRKGSSTFGFQALARDFI